MFEVVEVTLENFSKMEKFFEKLKPSFMSASKEPMEDFMKEEQPEEYLAIIKEGKTIEMVLDEEWNMFIDKIHTFSTLSSHKKVFFATIQNERKDVLGFSTFLPVSQKKLFTEGQKIIGERKNIKWLKNSGKPSESENEVFVEMLVVDSNHQRRGFGKKLIFSIFSYLPETKKIYLETSTSKTNYRAHKFYNRYHFEIVATHTTKEGFPCFVYEFIK